MKKLEVIWFSNRHEHSVQWCKLGLMRLAKQGEIRLRQIPNELASGYLDEPLVAAVHRRKAVVLVKDGDLKKTVLLDGEDSVFQTSSLIKHCDLYFMCAFRKSFFERQPFDLGYCWQTEQEVLHYQLKWAELQEGLGDHFHKARSFMPIGPNLTTRETPVSPLKQKLFNAVNKSRAAVTSTRDWQKQHAAFETRYQSLESLRSANIKFDVVLRDSLWGWPRHRIALHKKLADYQKNYNIHSQLNYRECFDYEYTGFTEPNPKDFPITTGNPDQDNYESMLASSKLAVFCTGFHWGCRNIQTLAWFLGLHIYSDPLSFEFPGELCKLQTAWNDSGAWDQLNLLLANVQSSDEPQKRKQRQSAFDQMLKPEVVARRLLTEVLR